MTSLDEIEAELKQISPWPWKLIDGTSIQVPFRNESAQIASLARSCWSQPDDGKNLELASQQMFNAPFLTKSPERLAAMCKYIRTAEAWINRCPFSGQENPSTSLAEHEASCARLWSELQAARRGLGLEGKE